VWPWGEREARMTRREFCEKTMAIRAAGLSVLDAHFEYISGHPDSRFVAHTYSFGGSLLARRSINGHMIVELTCPHI